MRTIFNVENDDDEDDDDDNDDGINIKHFTQLNRQKIIVFRTKSASYNFIYTICVYINIYA